MNDALAAKLRWLAQQLHQAQALVEANGTYGNPHVPIPEQDSPDLHSLARFAEDLAQEVDSQSPQV